MMKKIISVITALSLLLPLLPLLAVDSQTAATSYLSAHNASPWTVMGLAAAGAGSINADFLKNISGSAAIDYEAPILAITGIGQNPRSFGATDYVAGLKSFHNAGQIGDATMINDDIFGILALVSSGVLASDPAIADAKTFILSHQASDGGWGYAVSANTDTNSTATAILGLVLAGVPVSDSHIQNAIAYLQEAQNDDGGFPYDPKSPYGTASDTSSTAWVMWAENALSTSWSKNGRHAADFLATTQSNTGYFEYRSGSGEDSFTPVTTAYAVIAVSGKSLPIKTLQSSAETFNFRIEGSSEQICSGKAAGPTVLDIVKNSSSQCGFTYHIAQTGFGPYLDQIVSDQASGNIGWLYFVNYSAPSVGAADYVLKTGDTVLWYYGDFAWKPTRLSLSSTEIASGAQAAATVEFFDNGNWQPLPQAKLQIGSSSAATDGTGKAELSAPDGYYKITAEKTGYVRSNSILLKIGSPTAASINLGVTIGSGSVLGETTPPDVVSFTVQPENLGFGTLKPGQSAEKSVTVANTGAKTIHLESIVSGDPLFTGSLLVAGSSWRQFSADLNAGAARDYPLKLTVPQDYVQTGDKAGQITFWAMAED